MARAAMGGRSNSAAGSSLAITHQPFGRVGDREVAIYTLTNAAGMEVRILTFGGIVQSLRVPDRDGHLANVVLGFANLEGYVTKSPYFGAIVGRYANRIAKGTFSLDGTTYRLPLNNRPNSLHGGKTGFDKHVWHASEVAAGDAVGLALSTVSPNGEEGYPGNLQVRATYRLTNDNALHIHYHAETDQPTVINLTNHTYFNLSGEGNGTIYHQELELAADHFTPIDRELIPTGTIRPVADTPFDFTRPTAIGARIRASDPQILFAKGYDVNFVLNRPSSDDASLIVAARVHDPRSGRRLDALTTEPGLQLYTANLLDGTLVGTGGKTYRQSDAFTLETQHFPNSPNRPDFPSTVLRPGQAFDSTTVYRFSW